MGQMTGRGEGHSVAAGAGQVVTADYSLADAENSVPSSKAMLPVPGSPFLAGRALSLPQAGVAVADRRWKVVLLKPYSCPTTVGHALLLKLQEAKTARSGRVFARCLFYNLRY
jgi:hypothetical protein